MKLRIRRQERVDARGVTSVLELVFCPAGQCSTRVDECQRCVHFLRLDDEDVECTPDRRVGRLVSEARGVTAEPGLGGTVQVGETMGEHSISIATNAPLSVAAQVLARTSVASPTGIVVDDEDRVVGTIELPETQLAGPSVSAGRLTRHVAPIRESATLANAITRMAKERRRTLPVVDDKGCVVGIISDVDALHWVAGHKAPQ